MTDRLPFGQLTGNLPNGGIFQDQFKVNHVYSGEIILAFIPAFQAASDFHSRGNSVFAGLESTCARLRGSLFLFCSASLALTKRQFRSKAP